MATIRDLFRQQNRDLYGLTGKAIIESRGVINPPRGAALLTSSPNGLADLIGNQIGGALKGSANRPSDTIFRNNTPLAKPITLGKTQRGIRDAIEANETYYVKQSPAPDSVFARLQQGATNPLGMLGNAAIGALNKFGSKKGLEDLKKYGNALKNDAKAIKLSADKATRPDGKVAKAKKVGSEHEPIFGIKTDMGHTFPTVVNYRELKNRRWDDVNATIQNNLYSQDGDTNSKLIEDSYYTYMKIKILGETNSVYFNGTISGINETFTPEWNTFKYIGSPFKVYTYTGIERTLTFDFKLYCQSKKEKDVMLDKLNYLTSLVYPYKTLTNTTYNEGATQQTMFAPNFIFLTIKSLYKNVFGFVDNLSFTIDDDVPWSNFEGIGDLDESAEKQMRTESTPSVINVQFGMKMIDSKNTLGYTAEGNTFNYRFRDNTNK